jgi:uncharacterized protein (TIGR00251 family)
LTAKNHGDTGLLSVRVTPNARRSEVIGFTDDVLQVRVAAPPEKGKANRELIACLSRALGVRRSSLTIVKGHTGRNKVVAIDGLSHEDVIRQLSR